MEELEYITHKALMKCDAGAAPGLFTPCYNTKVKINSCLVATAMDKASLVNIPSFVVCAKTQKPCVPATTQWQDTYPVKVKGQETLMGKSCIQCSLGGNIGFLSSGQVPLTAEEEAEIEGMRHNVQKAHEQEMEERDKPWWQKAGEFVIDLIPIVGPVVSLVKNVAQGNWGMAALDVGFLVLDVVGVAGALFTGGASLVATTAAKAAARAAIKGSTKAVANKFSKEAIKTAAKQTKEILSKLTVRNLTRGKLCVFACFPAGTPVALKEGFKSIEDIIVGDEVWAWDEKTQSPALKPVLHTFERVVNSLVELTLNGETVRSTPEHPYFVDGQWKAAGILEEGDEVQLLTGHKALVQQVRYAHQEVELLETDAQHRLLNIPSTEEGIKVYNLEVKDLGTYFVGWLGALVHNATKGSYDKTKIPERKELDAHDSSELDELEDYTNPSKLAKEKEFREEKDANLSGLAQKFDAAVEDGVASKIDDATEGAVNTVTRSESVLGHIFRNAPGHVNPSTATSKGRYINLFEKVANNPANLNQRILTPRAIENGVQGFTQSFRNGQIWVQTRNGKIFDAGVN